MSEQVVAFCIPGGHDGPVVGTASDGVAESFTFEGGTVPIEWQLVRASVVDGEWVYDPESPARIMCCNQHLPKGTPQ